MPWWGWAILAWIAFDAAFAIAWTMRARVRERNAIESRFDPDVEVDVPDAAPPEAEGYGGVPLDPRPHRDP